MLPCDDRRAARKLRLVLAMPAWDGYLASICNVQRNTEDELSTVPVLGSAHMQPTEQHQGSSSVEGWPSLRARWIQRA